MPKINWKKKTPNFIHFMSFTEESFNILSNIRF